MDPASDYRDPFLPQLEEEDRARIAAALRYMGRDLQHCSYAVNTERRELLWQEMDRCLALAERMDPQPKLAELPTPGETTTCTLITGASSGIGAALARQLAPSLVGSDQCLGLSARRVGRLEGVARASMGARSRAVWGGGLQ